MKVNPENLQLKHLEFLKTNNSFLKAASLFNHLEHDTNNITNVIDMHGGLKVALSLPSKAFVLQHF